LPVLNWLTSDLRFSLVLFRVHCSLSRVTRKLATQAGGCDGQCVDRLLRAGKPGSAEGSAGSEAVVPEREAGAAEPYSGYREAGAGVDGRTDAGVGRVGHSDGNWLPRSSDGRGELCHGALSRLLAADGDRVSGSQLVWRQPGRDAGASSPAATAALWVLRRPHDR